MNLDALATMVATAASPAPSSGGSADLLANLAVILCVAAVTTVVFQRIRQPVILGYLLAGLIVGPHLPVPLVADATLAHTLSELGVILLMFSLGLEFSLRKLARIAATAGVVALIQCSLMIWLGYVIGRMFGWTPYESLFTGAIIAISSTTIIVKAFQEQNIKGKLSELVFGILIAEDLIAILLLAILTAVATGAGVSVDSLARTTGRLIGLLALMMVGGLLVVPRLMRMVVRLHRNETTLVAAVGVCFGFALLARQLGYSVALGAFVGGALVAESGEAKRIEHLVEPVRDMFAAIFFVAVGMLIEPRLVLEHGWAVVVLTLVVIAGKLLGVSIGAFLAGSGVRTSIQAGMSLAQIGEFSFIIAAVGLSLGVVGSFLYPIAVAVSALTTLVTPWLIRAAAPFAAWVDRRLPHALQTFAALYGSWVEALRQTPRTRTLGARLRRLVGFLLLDVSAIAGVVIGASAEAGRLVALAGRHAGIAPRLAHALVMTAAALIAAPFVLGAVRLARAFGATLALHALPAADGAVDLAAAPRRALVVTLQLATLFAVGIPLVAVVQPFVPAVPTAIGVGLMILTLAIPFWRSTTNLESHVRAGVQVIAEAVEAQTRTAPAGADRPEDVLDAVRPLLPGLGDPRLVRLAARSPAAGKSLKQLNLRGRSGATVVALKPAGGAAVIPTGDERLAEGDTLVLAGSSEAVDAALPLLRAPELIDERPPPPLDSMLS